MNSEYLAEILIYLLCGGVLGALAFWAVHRMKLGTYQKIGQDIVYKAEIDAKAIKSAGEITLKQALIEQQRECEFLLQNEKKKLQKEEDRFKSREDKLEARMNLVEKKLADIEKKEAIIAGRKQQIDEERKIVSELHENLIKQLESLTGLSSAEAKELLLSKITNDIKNEAAHLSRKIRKEAEEQAEQEAKRIVVASINRLAVPCVSEATVNTVTIPNDEMKGRIIGREGRNIRALEHVTGINFIIDDTPGAIVLSGFDPIRMQIAKMALLELVKDGRIHPTRIEEVVEKAKLSVNKLIRQYGEEAAFKAGAMNISPELITLLGKLKFRFSYGQNVLDHSLEVSYIMGLIAAELGADIRLAKRIGLLHDIKHTEVARRACMYGCTQFRCRHSALIPPTGPWTAVRPGRGAGRRLARAGRWQLAGAPGDQVDGDLDRLRGSAGVTNALQQQLRGDGAHGNRVLRDDGDAGLDDAGERDVVEADVRHLPLPAHGRERCPRPERQQVLRREHGRGCARGPEQLADGPLSRLRGADIAPDQGLVFRDAALAERGLVAAVAFRGRGSVAQVSEEPDPRVPVSHQVGHRAPGAADVIAQHRVGGHRGGRAAGEHHLDAAAYLRQQVAVIGRARVDDQPVDAPRAERGEQGPLPLRAAVRARAKQQAVALAHHLLDGAEQLGGGRVRHVFEQHADGGRELPRQPQVARRDVVPVVQLLDGVPHPGGPLRPHAAPAVDHPGHCHDADSGQRRDISHCRVSATLWAGIGIVIQTKAPHREIIIVRTFRRRINSI